MRYRNARATLAQVKGDDGVAMMVALMMIMIMLALSVLVLGLVVNEVAPTHFAQKNTKTIFAAEAGVEASLGRIRSAVAAPDFTGSVFGDPHQLPCSLTGTVDTAGGTTTYNATIRYFSDDPSGRDETWLSSHALACATGSGTGTVLPAYALIASAGAATSSGKVAATSGDRAISMVYRFSTTTTNVAGGRIYAWNGASAPQFCLRADGVAAGSTVSYQAASTCGLSANDSTELWVYDTDYTLKLASSTLTSTALCMTSGSGGSITLQNCSSPVYNQLWAWDSGGRATWVGQDSGINDNGTCLYSGRTSGTPMVGDKLKVGSTCANQAAWGSFSPDPAVGPGAASVNTHQIVNYLEFGRCMDVTDTDVTKAFMISYPCKQDPPSGANLYWNHKWFYQEPLVGAVAPAQQIYVYNQGNTSQKYCLQAPIGTTAPAYSGISSGWYVTFTAACSTSDPRQMWVRSKDTGDKTTRYTFQSTYTYSGVSWCIGVGPSKYNGNWSALIVSACNGSTAQKWNAPADTVHAQLGNYLEETH